MNTTQLIEELRSLGRPGPGFKPHKSLLLFAVIRLIKSGHISGGRVYYNDQLKDEFQHLLDEYGAPDDRDRPYNPFFHLSSSSLWKLVPRRGCQDELANSRSISGPTMLQRIVEYAQLSQSLLAAIEDEQSCALIEDVLLSSAVSGRHERRRGVAEPTHNNQRTLRRLVFSSTTESHGNPFVEYLNSLQRLNGSNENALAEYQACNPFFATIHVLHPVTQEIVDELLRPDGRQVILTGHAGDGKSTVALDVYKALTGAPADLPMSRKLRPREDLPDADVCIFKDLSERRREEDAALVKELLEAQKRFLIVSNTGALLDFFRQQASAWGGSALQIESDVLAAISEEQGKADLVLGDTRFLVVNLARMDNLDIAQQVFERMVDPARWEACADRSCRSNCPICLNVDLINHRRDIVLDRLFLAYRRMYEYGTRLTLRQLTEHLAYLITSGLEESDLAEMRQRGATPLKAEFMFFNRFFGDNGKEDHAAALQMRVVREVRRQGFGERPCPTWERKLWLKMREGNLQLGVEECEAEFEILRSHGSGAGGDSQPGLTPDQAREQVRRMMYFLYDFSRDSCTYLVQFLNSPMILQWQGWQVSGAQLEMTERNVLEQRIYHVLQEHFTGVRLPEGSRGHDRRLYITLSRGRSEIRQSAQVVVAQVDWSNETRLQLTPQPNAAGGSRTDLALLGSGRITGAKLVLTLPFLDYVLMRHVGDVGETLQAAYVERLERFKAQIQDLAREASAHVMLVRLRTDHTFRRQQYTVREGKLEVNDVL